MSAIFRKQKILPSHLDVEQLEDIFAHLEKHPEKPQSKRVEKILELLSCLGSDSERVRVRIGLDNALRGYQWVRKVKLTPDEGFRVTHAAADRGNLSKDDDWEYRAVGVLLDVVPYIGKPPRIRRCEECRGWFFAKNNTRKWHDGCRQRHYAKDPAARAKKKEYMSNRYDAEKKRSKNPKSGVGLAKRRTALRHGEKQR
jgi:hypothetical protein